MIEWRVQGQDGCDEVGAALWGQVRIFRSRRQFLMVATARSPDIAGAQTARGQLQATLDQAQSAAADCRRQYEAAPPRIRRQINQGFFRRLPIGPGGTVERAEMTELFAALLADGQVVRAAETAAEMSQMDGDE